MSDISYNMEPVDEKPKKEASERRGGFKYDPIIETFLKSGHRLVKVGGTGKEAYYLSGQLRRALEHREMNSVTVSVRNREVYLEKT